MYLENLSLLNFKNYSDIELTFSTQINCFVGDNGSGKTNLLDAIHYLCLTKSAFNLLDSQNIKHGEAFFMAKGKFNRQDKEFIVSCSLKSGHKKNFQVNKKSYTKISEHIGKFPIVLIAPDDTELIKEGSENRRKFFDGILSQLDHFYLEELIKYNNLLKQRNSLLKQFNERNYFDKDILETYDEQLLTSGNKIYHKRKDFIASYTPVFQMHYQNISNSKELVSLEYSSDHQKQDFEKDFKNRVKRDILLQRTTAGIHKDDFLFNIGEYPLKKFGSQGQIKSFLVALKLAQFDIIQKEKGTSPLLLLDDIFDKLDDLRISKLVQMVSGNAFGQIFITDARPERTLGMIKNIRADKKVFLISDNDEEKFKELDS
jgi:DNA replication and repair protein RecF